MDTNSQLRRKVIDELEWDPSIDASKIGVAAKDGVVTLTGTVSSYLEKQNAEQATKCITGVKAVADELTITLPGQFTRNDADIAETALSGLKFNTALPKDRVQVTVDNGWVKLEGQVDWQYQRIAAENSVRYLMGVKGVTNLIKVKPRVSASDVKSKIQSAFARNAQIDANNVTVDATGSTVTLRGKVRSWSEKQAAEMAAFSAPGVTVVDNELAIGAW